MDCELYREKMTTLQGQVAELQKERDQVSLALGDQEERTQASVLAGTGRHDSTFYTAPCWCVDEARIRWLRG